MKIYTEQKQDNKTLKRCLKAHKKCPRFLYTRSVIRCPLSSCQIKGIRLLTNKRFRTETKQQQQKNLQPEYTLQYQISLSLIIMCLSFILYYIFMLHTYYKNISMYDCIRINICMMI